MTPEILELLQCLAIGMLGIATIVNSYSIWQLNKRR